MSNYGEFDRKTLVVCGLEQETQSQLNEYEVLYTGVGKVNATYKLTQKFGKFGSYIPYDLIINYGTAGSRELPVGELVDCTKFIQRDMDCTGFGIQIGQPPVDDTEIVLDSNSEFNPIGKHYVCGTGDNFVQDVSKELPDVDVFDMEAYALAKTCWKTDIDFVSFKYVTDNADESSPNDWLENCDKGVEEFKKVLEYYDNL